MQHGTVLYYGKECEDLIVSALDLGFRTIDTALLYGCQEAVGKGIKKSGISRDKIKITSKVGYFPPNSEGKIFPWEGDNMKGDEAASIDKSLKQLQVDYVDCFLVHTPITSPEEFKAGIVPHFFEFAHDVESGKGSAAQEMAIFERSMKIEPIKTIDGDDMLELITEARMGRHRKKGIDFE